MPILRYFETRKQFTLVEANVQLVTFLFNPFSPTFFLIVAKMSVSKR